MNDTTRNTQCCCKDLNRPNNDGLAHWAIGQMAIERSGQLSNASRARHGGLGTSSMRRIGLRVCVALQHLMLLGSLILPLCFGQAAKAGEEPATSKIVGLGATSCLQFTNDVKQNPAVQRDYLAWAQGFMSGILLSRPSGVDDALDLNPPAFGLLKQLAFLSEHCAKNTSAGFSDAVEALYRRLRKVGTT